MFCIDSSPFCLERCNLESRNNLCFPVMSRSMKLFCAQKAQAPESLTRSRSRLQNESCVRSSMPMWKMAQLPCSVGLVTGKDRPIHVSFTVEFFKDIATNISDQREANHSGTCTSFQSRFSMFDKILQYMMISFSNSGALDISQRWHAWRPVLVLESPKLLLISFCIPAILSFIFLNKWSWPGPVTVNSWVRDLATGQIGLKATK